MSGTEMDKYEVLSELGRGSFGICKKVRRKTDGKVLCRKEIEYFKMGQKEREQLHAEISILSSLRHPNIVGYYHRDHLKTSQHLHIYMEYCGGGDLSKTIKNLIKNNQYAEEAFVWSIFTQLTIALYHCHYGKDAPDVGDNVMAPGKRDTSLRTKNQVTILHRDLKPDNVFLGEDNTVKLGDFGLSKLMQSHDFASTYVGTPFYMSPEICAAERYTLKSDVWALGCIMYELCCREPPFNARTHFQLIQKIKEGVFKPLPSMYSIELSNLISSCLKTNPMHRPETRDLVELPIVRLIRKEREVVELGKVLRAKEVETFQMKQEAESLLATLGRDKEAMRVGLDATIRREWEVKARLEIDKRVDTEKRRLQAMFDMELEKQVQSEVEKRLHAEVGRVLATKQSQIPVNGTHSPTPTTMPGLSSTASTVPSTGSPATDLSTLSLDSPEISGREPPQKKSTRTPFSRARTQIDSPMDTNMIDPSPMSIASLNLSPRRAAALAQGATAQDLFSTAAEQRARWQPQLMTSSEDELVDGGDDLPELPSPTRAPRLVQGPSDPFKVPRQMSGRPAMRRQSTLPVNRLVTQLQPALFSNNNTKAETLHGTANELPSPSSPTRRLMRAPLTKALTTAGGDDMLKAVTQRNMLTTGAGRTLVELNQARMAGVENLPPPAAKLGSVQEPGVAVWDPERDDDMPSPFIKRGRNGVIF